jgi:2-phospho-L-lactate guanylyltransferase
VSRQVGRGDTIGTVQDPRGGWTVVLPLKGGPRAKSRLAAGSALASAIAFDCLDAVLDAWTPARVVVVTSDPRTGGLARLAGATVRRESAPGAGLLPAIADGVAAAGEGPVAVLLGDLPALRPEDLDEALALAQTALAGAQQVFVPDADGTGTVLLAARGAAALRPAFGPGSAAAHEALGALRLEPALPRLRRDVDTADDLAEALALGCGPRTATLAVA